MASTMKGELKVQGVVDAARDPSTNVTAEDAQKTMLAESKKAGVAALHFDPNASAEEKAAQAKAAQVDTNRPHRVKGVGIATDLGTDGPDDYDLPPPTTSGVVPQTSPSDTTKLDANGVALGPDQWKKLGWEPRFGSGETASIKDEPSLLDHQTWLEGKLDPRLYGEWFHNAAIIIFACLTSWVIGVLGGGLGWAFLVMAACSTYYRTSIRRVRRNFRDDITRELAKAKLETDTETLEWMNSFLVKFWPIYAPQLAASVVQSVDQVLSTSTPAFLDSMRMETFVLGTKPPRMEHVKTYPRVEDDIVQMDWRFSFTPTDILDMTARQLKYKINPKVVLEVRIGKGMVSKAMKIIVEDFSFSGLVRVKIKLQLEFPHIERIDFCFLERPDIDYVCKPLGGDTFGFDINFIPGLENFIKEQIHGNLAPIMYAPNVFPIEVAKMLSGNPIDMAIGVIAVTIYGGAGLRNPDKFSGTPDPYVALSLNSRNELSRTKTVHENANPRWNETLYIIISSYTDALTMHVFDYNEFRKDKDLGIATFALDQLETITEHESLSLEVIMNGKPRGTLTCDIRFFPVLEAQKAADGTQVPPPESNTGIARLTLEQAKDLDGTKSMVGALNPYGVLILNGKEVHITKKLKRTNNPIFPDPSISVLVTDRKKARIGLAIKDDRDLAHDPVVGSYQIKLDDMMKLVEKGQEWFFLQGTKTGRAKLSVDWRPVALKGLIGASGGYITPIGVVRIHFKSASELRNFETLGKSDPYGRVLLSGIDKGRTVTFRNNLNPTWDEVVYVPVHAPSERLTVEVMDEEKLGKDRSLGLIEIRLADYVQEGDGGSYVASGKKDFADGLRMNGQGATKGILNYSIAFYPTIDVVDPEEEAADKAAEEEARAGMPAIPASPTQEPASGTPSRQGSIRKSAESARPQIESRKSLETAGKIGHTPKPSIGGQSIAASTMSSSSRQKRPKIHVGADDLQKYECGLLVFNIIEGNFAQGNVQLEVVMDDQLFPSYTSSKARQRHHTFGEIGDAFVREIDYSRITLRLVERVESHGNEGEKHVLAKLTGPTLSTLQQCLYTATELTLKGNDGQPNKVIVKLKYLPVEMQLDPSESINNSGDLRVEVLDADDLPSADRNGFSDPYCRFKLNGKDIYKTKVQKKTLHPAWNEYFETPINSRTGADFRCDVYDWDFGDKADYLGGTDINLSMLEPFQPQEMTYTLDGKCGAIRLKFLFKPAYVTRARQGTSTLSGTFAVPGKVVGAPVKGVAKVGGAVGGGVVRGASFLKRGLTSRHHSRDEPMSVTPDNGSRPVTPSRQSALVDGAAASPATPAVAVTPASTNGIAAAPSLTGTPGTNSSEMGTAYVAIVSATGYPGADVRVVVRMLTGKGSNKEVLKTKAIKATNGDVTFDPDHEHFKVSCSADTHFQVSVKDHGTFSSKDLGEAGFILSDQGAGSDKAIKVGSGTVHIRSRFQSASVADGTAESLRPATTRDRSPDSKKEGRRSFFGRREASGKTE